MSIEKITRQEVLYLYEALGSLPKDIKDFEYHLCLIENTERLEAAVNKIREALKAAAYPAFLETSVELSKRAAEIAKEKSITDWYEAMTAATDELPEEEKEKYIEMQKAQAEIETKFLAEPSDIELYKLEKSKLPSPLPLDLRQTIVLKYFIK